MSRNSKIVPMLLVILAAVAPARARADEPLTLEQAMTRARAGALEAQAASALVAAGDERLRQARSYRKPQVRLQEIWTRTDSPAEAFGLMLNQERFSLAEFSAGDPNDPNPIENALTRFEVELPVYTGGEIGGRIRQAELAATGARQSSAWVEDQAAWAAGEAYVRLLQAREQVSLLETTIAAVDAHVALARAFVEQGMLVRSEQLRAEVEAARVRELVIEAHGRTRVAAANLGFRLGEDGPRDWRLESLVEPQPPGEPLEAWLASADQRLDLEAARRQVEAGELEEPILLSALKPKIGLLARHDRYDRSLFGSSGTSSAVLAVASIDLFAGGRHRAAAASARAAAAAAALEVERFRQGIRLEVRDAYESALSAHERQASARAALAAARETERITGQRFESGLTRTIDVLDAVSARREAETRELVARAESRLALLRLAVVSGRRPEAVLDPAPATARDGGGSIDDPSDDRGRVREQ